MQKPQDPSWIATHGSHPLPLTCSVDGECAAEGGTDLSALLMILGFLALSDILGCGNHILLHISVIQQI